MARELSWRIWGSALLGVAGILSILATSRPQRVRIIDPNGPDTTPPSLNFGSSWLPDDVLINELSSGPQTRRARSSDDVYLVATASDSETGMRSVTIRGQMVIECISLQGNDILRIAESVAETSAAPTGQPTLPGYLRSSLMIKIPEKRARCPLATRYHQFTATLHAEAENGKGLTRILPDAIVRAFGPDEVRIATFNMGNPGNLADEVFERWGRGAASQADVLFFQQAPDRRRAKLVADNAGMPYLVFDTHTGIASRAPIRNLDVRNNSGSIIVSGVTDLAGWPHQVIGVHFTTHGAQGRDPWHTSELRLSAAQELIAMLEPAPAIAIVGGDFNAYSGDGPQIQPGATDEMNLLRTRLQDVYTTLGIYDELHCSSQRIDYILIQGPYKPSDYDACSGLGAPSDHPFVLATLDVD